MAANWTGIEVCAVLFFASAIRSSLGFGEALVSVPLLALLMPVEVAAPLAVLVSITIALVAVLQDWRHIHLRSAGRLVLFTLGGIPLGLLLLKLAPEGVVKVVLGLVIAAFSVYSLAGGKQMKLGDDGSSWLFGFTAGILGGAYGMNGPPLAIYGSLRGRPQAVSSDTAGILLTRQPRRYVRVWHCRPMDHQSQSFLLLVAPCSRHSHFAGKDHQSPFTSAPLSLDGPWGFAGDRRSLNDRGDRAISARPCFAGRSPEVRG
jgi:hypothetical protein